MDSFLESLAAERSALESTGNLRTLREIAQAGGAYCTFNGKRCANFSSNDYMGIAGDYELRREFYEQYPDLSSPELAQSAASSRLLTGNTPAYTRLEEKLSALYGCGRSALVFNCGYHANTGILPSLAKKGDLILSDKLNHASIIDGMKLCEADFLRYRHLDCAHLEKLIVEKSPLYKRIFVITESLFSMDGDEADLKKIAELKRKYGFVLIVDEAHSVGVRGPRGAGMCAALGIVKDVDVIVGTFGKAFGSTGAYAICDPLLREHMVNCVRPFIFTTGLPPVVLNWSSFVLDKIALMDDRRAKLRRMGMRLREIFVKNAPGSTLPGDSQIVPFIVGEAEDAVRKAEAFRDNGILVFPIRPPTVPKGTSRLRFSIPATMDENEIERMEAML